MKTRGSPVQLGLFAARRRNVDEAKLIRRLMESAAIPTSQAPVLLLRQSGGQTAEVLSEAEWPRPLLSGPGTMSRAEVKRLMTPLPRITALDE